VVAGLDGTPPYAGLELAGERWPEMDWILGLERRRRQRRHGGTDRSRMTRRERDHAVPLEDNRMPFWVWALQDKKALLSSLDWCLFIDGLLQWKMA
jgi:hypothetical protein